MKTVVLPALLAAGVTLADAKPTSAQPLQIRHEPVRCFLAERYPELDACLEPAAAVQRARAYFRAEASRRWHYVEMRPVGTCYRGTLPRPQASSARVLYYISAVATDRTESRTAAYAGVVVADERSCPTGRAGPFLSGAAVAVGGGALPSGFIGVEGPASKTAKKAVFAVVGAGAVGAAVALSTMHGSSASTTMPETTTTLITPTSTTIIGPPTTTSTTTTTTRPPSTTTTTSTTLPPPTTTTSTTTTTTQPPPTTTTTTTTTRPPPTTTTTTTTTSTTTTTTQPPPTTTTTTTSTTTTTLPPPTTTTTTSTTTTTLPPPTTTTTTTLPPPTTTTTTEPPPTTTTTTTTTTLPAITTTTSKKKSALQAAQLAPQRDGEPLHRASEVKPASRGVVWTSELSVAGGRGQVIANGTDVSYPGTGRADVVLLLHRGANQVEAVLADASGTPGTWSFTLASGAVRPGSLRVVAGDAVAVGPQVLAFRLRGRPGERAVFSFEAE